MNGLVAPLFPKKKSLPPSAICSIDTETMTLRRYEIGGAKPRLTHKARIATANDIGEIVSKFMAEPPSDFAVESPLFVKKDGPDRTA